MNIWHDIPESFIEVESTVISIKESLSDEPMVDISSSQATSDIQQHKTVRYFNSFIILLYYWLFHTFS